MENTENFNYVYVLLDTLNKGEYKFGKYEFEYEPFYVGVSNVYSIHDRESRHIHYAKMGKDVTNNKYKMNIINRMFKNKRI